MEVGDNSEQQFETSAVHPLFEAVINGDLDGIDALLKEGVTADYQNENGWTSAIYAVEYHKYESLLKVIWNKNKVYTYGSRMIYNVFLRLLMQERI